MIEIRQALVPPAAEAKTDADGLRAEFEEHRQQVLTESEVEQADRAAGVHEVLESLNARRNEAIPPPLPMDSVEAALPEWEAPETPAPPVMVEPKEPFSLERFMGVKLFAWLGGVPVLDLTARSSAPLFTRRFVAAIEGKDDLGNAWREDVGSADWTKSGGGDVPLTLALNGERLPAKFILETHDGDNPPITLDDVVLRFAAPSIIAKLSDAAPLFLCYGNPKAAPPQYDLRVVRNEMLAAEPQATTLGDEEILRPDARDRRAPDAGRRIALAVGGAGRSRRRFAGDRGEIAALPRFGRGDLSASRKFLKTSRTLSNYLANPSPGRFLPRSTINLGRSGTRWIHPLRP